MFADEALRDGTVAGFTFALQEEVSRVRSGTFPDGASTPELSLLAARTVHA